jgi:uncharacterized protein YjbI with pentapeptide repeats
MTKFPLLMLLLLAFTPSFAVNLPKHCPDFSPSKDKAKWRWMDGDCHIRTRADLDRILKNHKLWIKKYSTYLEDPKALATHGALRDRLRADLSGAQLRFADLNGADLIEADLTGADLIEADLTRAFLTGADLTGSVLPGADLTGADLIEADLTGAVLSGADLTGAVLPGADLTGAHLDHADLTRAYLRVADLTGAYLYHADLTGADLAFADLSSAILAGADLSNADCTRAALWYADFEPEALPPVGSIARAEGLQTLRWNESFNELRYRLQLKIARESHGPVSMPKFPSLPERWLLWLSRYRERLEGKTSGWRDDLGFLWSDLVYGLQTNQTRKQAPKVNGAAVNSSEKPLAKGAHGREQDEPSSVAQGKYAVLDLRNALNKAGYSEAELQVNLAYQRHTQSTVGMILYDWTCDYGAAPSRPLILALALALLAVPIYWLGFRHRWFGAQLLMVEKPAEKEVVTDLGDPQTRPNWRTPLGIEDISTQTRLQKLLTRLRLERPVRWLGGFIASFWPRLRWEGGFFKAVVFFSLISIINLGFSGFDFGRWVRLLFFREYELKAHGWLRMVSGLQSLVGLGLLALSLLSFFGHPFE